MSCDLQNRRCCVSFNVSWRVNSTLVQSTCDLFRTRFSRWRNLCRNPSFFTCWIHHRDGNEIWLFPLMIVIQKYCSASQHPKNLSVPRKWKLNLSYRWLSAVIFSLALRAPHLTVYIWGSNYVNESVTCYLVSSWATSANSVNHFGFSSQTNQGITVFTPPQAMI